MTEKKIYYAIETALNETPREDWPTSRHVSHALLNCSRLRGIVRKHIIKRGVGLSYLDDVVSEIAVVMQMKMLSVLVEVKDVYFVAFRVSTLVVSNYGKKSINTSYSEEVSISTLLQDGDDEQDALERLSSLSELYERSEKAEKKIDLDNAKRRFSEKINGLGWPADIQKERTRLGRPPKQQASPAAAGSKKPPSGG